MVHWRYASATEIDEFDLFPAPERIEVEVIFPVVSGKVVSRHGQELLIPDGKVVKLLEMDGGEPWCYRAKELTVRMAEKEVSLRPGTLVAVFSRP